MPQIIGIIPARFASSRFPGKPLALIQGKSLIQRTYESAARCTTLEKLLVATDDSRIYDHVTSFGGEARMTSLECPTGTDRLAEVARGEPTWADDTILINIQGDEPCVDPQILDKLAEALIQDPEAAASTPIMKIKEEAQAFNPSLPKCVIDYKGYALYFSRHLIPAGFTSTFRPEITYWRHLGLYGYRKHFLLRYTSLPSTPLQQAEDLEQLKILEYGYKIKTVPVDIESFEINHPEDIKKMEQHLGKQNTSSSQAESAPH
jgi:3-deoxy-manno-octulosonate cytidylyltransferase (CMP-KDO synthetase)